MVLVADRVIDARAKVYLSTLERQATNHIGSAFGQISNQIALEFRQPRIKAVIEQAARDRSMDVFTNKVRPALEAFQDAIDLANSQLARSSNIIAQLESEALAAQRRIPPPTPTPASSTTHSGPGRNGSNRASGQTSTDSICGCVGEIDFNQSHGEPNRDGLHLDAFFPGQQRRFQWFRHRGCRHLQANRAHIELRLPEFQSLRSAHLLCNWRCRSIKIHHYFWRGPDVGAGTFRSELSSKVRLVSDSFDTDLTIPVAAEKMQLPTAGK